MIDWTLPVETVPNDRNPEPVACEVGFLEEDGIDVRFLGPYHFRYGGVVPRSWFITRRYRDYVPFSAGNIHLRNVPI